MANPKLAQSADCTTTETNEKYTAAQLALCELSNRYSEMVANFQKLNQELDEVDNERKELRASLDELYDNYTLLRQEVHSYRSGHPPQAPGPLAASSEDPAALRAELTQLQNELNALKAEVVQKDALFSDVVNSRSFRLGSLIFAIPRKIKNLLHKS